MSGAIDWIEETLEQPWPKAATIVVGAIVAAYVFKLVVHKTLARLAERTTTNLDDKVISALDRPIFVSVVLYGLSWASEVVPMPHRGYSMTEAVLKTLAVWVWGAAAFKISHDVLASMSARARQRELVNPRTLPLFDIFVKITIIAAAIYGMFLAWNIDLTAWLASAGIIGIAIGFAAQDTLANLFSGLFILADAPYKLDDFIVLDGGLRGRVTAIGVRSTRILTQDDVEITIPNAVIGQSKIVNEAGGRWIKQRVRVQVEAAYGSDIDQVKEAMMTCADDPGVADDPPPEVRFTAFGGSGLAFELLVYIDEPAERDRILSRLNSAVYKKFGEADIEIPYSKHDVYIKEMKSAE